MQPIRRMSYDELQEAEKRNKKLLLNRLFLEKLPDKGKKLRETHEKIVEQLKKCHEERELANLFSGMKVDVDKMEWAGGIVPPFETVHSGDQNQPVPRKEDETDIVNILCTTNQLEKIVIQESETVLSNHKYNKDKFFLHLMEKADQQHQVDDKFKPFKSLKHEKPPKNTLPPKWENTAATPPPYAHRSGGVLIPIIESLECQIENEEKVRDYEIQRSRIHFSSNSFEPSSVSFSPDVITINPEEDEQVYDEDEQYEVGLVVKTSLSEESAAPIK